MVKAVNFVCQKSLAAFATRAFKVVEPGRLFEYNWHIDCVSEHLQALEVDGNIDGKRRLCINIPPRTLKSYLASIVFPAWVMGLSPNTKFICTSHKFELAKEMALKTKILMESDWYRQVFNTRIDNRQNEKHNFWTTERGMYYSSPILSVTGRGGDYIILDDPISPQESYSTAMRNATNETIRSTLPTRLNDARTGRWLMIMQRTHADDPTGNLVLDNPDWYLLKLPGENRTQKTFSYFVRGKSWKLEPEELLFGRRFSKNVLDQYRRDMGEANFAGQILQEPVPLGGGDFDLDWMQYYQKGDCLPRQMNIYIVCDPSGGEEMNRKKKKTGDFSVFSVVGLNTDNNYYVLDMVRDRLNPTQRIDTLIQLHKKWNKLSGRPPKVGYEKYGMMSDVHHLLKEQASQNYRFPVIELGGKVMKEERIRGLIPSMESKRWYFPYEFGYIDCENKKIDLIKEIQDEMLTFPRSRYDDILDSLSRIFEEKLEAKFPAMALSVAEKEFKKNFEAEENYSSWMDY